MRQSLLLYPTTTNVLGIRSTECSSTSSENTDDNGSIFHRGPPTLQCFIYVGICAVLTNSSQMPWELWSIYVIFVLQSLLHSRFDKYSLFATTIYGVMFVPCARRTRSQHSCFASPSQNNGTQADAVLRLELSVWNFRCIYVYKVIYHCIN